MFTNSYVRNFISYDSVKIESDSKRSNTLSRKASGDLKRAMPLISGQFFVPMALKNRDYALKIYKI
jgi:hypothetical protein